MTSVYTRLHGRKFSSTASPHARAQKLCGAGRLVLIPINEGRGTQPEVEPRVCPWRAHHGWSFGRGGAHLPAMLFSAVCTSPAQCLGVPGACGQCLPAPLMLPLGRQSRRAERLPATDLFTVSSSGSLFNIYLLSWPR